MIIVTKVTKCKWKKQLQQGVRTGFFSATVWLLSVAFVGHATFIHSVQAVI